MADVQNATKRLTRDRTLEVLRKAAEECASIAFEIKTRTKHAAGHSTELHEALVIREKLEDLREYIDR